MLSHCANSQCRRPFLQLGQGKLFLVETEPATELKARRVPQRLERYWLCDDCAEVSTLVHDPKQGIVLTSVPRPQASTREALVRQFSQGA